MEKLKSVEEIRAAFSQKELRILVAKVLLHECKMEGRAIAESHRYVNRQLEEKGLKAISFSYVMKILKYQA